MKPDYTMDRRRFMKLTSLTGAGLLISLYLGGCEGAEPTAEVGPVGDATLQPDQVVQGSPVEISLYVRIGYDDKVTIFIPRPDIGQGSRTAMAMIVAEELGAVWEDVEVEQAQPDARYLDQVTGGSLGISNSYRTLREAGAVVRDVLLAAAAARWEVPVAECQIESGIIHHTTSELACKFSEVLDLAVEIDPPAGYSVNLKDPSEFQIIGTSIRRIDGPSMVRGAFKYASDLTLENMSYAVILRPPVFGSSVRSFDENSALAIDGVQKIVEISSGMAVLANSTWAAFKGREALQVVWDETGDTSLSSESLSQQLRQEVVPAGWRPGMDPSDSLSAVYEIPFYAHVQQEPLVCLAHVTQGGCELWAPTQDPRLAQQTAAQTAGISAEDVTVHVMVSGGGFGRRLQVDFVREAVEVSTATDLPIKLIWSREDDIRHDYYHPLSVHYIEASLSSPSLPRMHSRESNDIPTGAWRSVTNFTQALVRESFIDEMAAAMNRDPLDLRMEIEPDALHGVLERAATEAGWGTPLPEGWARGLACHSTWNVTPVAQVAEVSMSPQGLLKVERMICAIDCGVVINPNMVREQMEGGIAFGLSAVLKGGITLEGGRVVQSNFHDYPILTMAEMPQVEVHILESDRDPSGVGEMGVPPAAPAVLNAVFNLTGERIRQFPASYLTLDP